IYKGRVMRVLPGMQSAFVDIGLDRDAFLYVTDFFDEEAEFERIVVDKSKKGDAEGAARAATEHIEIARVQREQQVESSHERAEPLRELEPGAIVAEEKPDEEAEPAGARRRGRRGGRGRGRTSKSAAADGDERSIIPTQAEPIDTPFVSSGASFERVSDDEAGAMNGEMFKDARLQERIMDAVHAVEFDLEDVPSAAVGSLLSDGLTEDAGFQRVADDEEAAPAVRRAAPVKAAHVDRFVDDITPSAAHDAAFQRISDDDENAAANSAAEETGAVKSSPSAATEKRRKRSGVIGRLFKSKKSEDEEVEREASTETDAESTTDQMADSEASITTARPHEEFATRRGGRRRRRPTKRTADAEADGSNGADEGADEPEELAATEEQPLEAQAADEPEEDATETDDAPEA